MPRMWCVPLATLFICSVHLQPWVGSGVTRLAWPCHPERGADLLSQRCALPTDDRDWLYANTCRKGWVPIFGKWQDSLKLPAWLNRGEMGADKGTVPQVEKKPPGDWKCFVWHIPPYSMLILRGRFCITAGGFFFLSLILLSWKTSFFRLSVYYLDKQQNAATAITLMIKGL